jgi:hypothetical protein
VAHTLSLSFSLSNTHTLCLSQEEERRRQREQEVLERDDAKSVSKKLAAIERETKKATGPAWTALNTAVTDTVASVNSAWKGYVTDLYQKIHDLQDRLAESLEREEELKAKWTSEMNHNQLLLQRVARIEGQMDKVIQPLRLKSASSDS